MTVPGGENRPGPGTNSSARIIIGLGNPIVSDDAVGLRAAELLGACLPGVVVEQSVINLDLLEAMDGFESVVVVDAMRTGEHEPGTVVRIEEAAWAGLKNFASPHSLNLPAVLSMGRKLGYRLPEAIRVYGIEVQDLETYAERMTPEIEAALPSIVARIRTWEEDEA